MIANCNLRHPGLAAIPTRTTADWSWFQACWLKIKREAKSAKSPSFCVRNLDQWNRFHRFFHLQALSTINVKLYDIGHMPMISKHGIAIVLSCAAVTWWCGTHIKRAARHLVGTPMLLCCGQQMIQGVWSCIPGLPCDFLSQEEGMDLGNLYHLYSYTPIYKSGAPDAAGHVALLLARLFCRVSILLLKSIFLNRQCSSDMSPRYNVQQTSPKNDTILQILKQN